MSASRTRFTQRMSRYSGEQLRKPLPRKLRRYFLVGLVVIAPVGLTVAVLRWVFERIDNILGIPLESALGISLPGLGLALLLAFILFTGWLAHLAAGRQVLNWWNRALSQFPLTGRIYNAVSQIVQSVIGSRRRLFSGTVLVPYPTDGIWAVAFVTNEQPAEMSDIVGEPCVSVFVPTTPNPTSGFMLVVPRTKLKAVDTTVEEAMKLIISAGVVPARVSRRGLDVESLLTDTGEWKRENP